MSIMFVWEGEQPSRPPATQVEDAMKASMRHFIDPRGISKAVVTVYLKQDNLQRTVVGVGYTDADAPVLTLRYSIIEPRLCHCHYYETPQSLLP